MNPDEIVGTPRESEIYLSPDWARRGATAAAVGPGATKVSIRTVTYRNGRIVTYVLDENHQPITHQVLSESVDPDVKAAWDKAQTTSQRGDQEGDVRGNEATNPNREVFHVGRGWVVEPNPLYRPPANAAGGTIQIEGTPNGQGGFDNERPVMVTRDASGKITESRPLTPAEEKDWRENRERSRNPGGKTDAEVQAQQPGRVSVPVEGYPGISQVTTKNPQTNAQDSHFENAQGQTVPDPRPAANATKAGVQQVSRNGRTYTVVTSLDPTTNTPTVRTFGPDGQEVPGGLPDEQKPAEKPTVGEGPGGGKIQYVPDPDHPGQVKAVPVPGAEAPSGAPTSMSTPTGPVGPVTTWLQTETEKLAKQAAEENWPRERFDAEVKRRLDFAHQLVAENTAAQAQENATADRVAANQRQAMSTSGGIATSIAPGMIKAGGEFLPGNGRVATEGLMAMLGMLGQYTQRASQQAGNAAGRTTISPDGTITVQHVPAGSAPPAQPAQDQADAAVRHAQAAAGVNTLGSAGTDPVFRPAPPTDVQPAAAGPDFTDPTTGQFGIPGSFSTGPYGAVPDWMQQQATQAAAPSGGDANEYLGMVGQDDPSWQAALAEANRRRSMSMAGAA